MKKIPLLVDKTHGYLCALVNCKQAGNTISCGIAAFKGGMSGDILVHDVDNEEAVYRIVVPESVKNIATHQVLISTDDDIQLSLR